MSRQGDIVGIGLGGWQQEAEVVRHDNDNSLPRMLPSDMSAGSDMTHDHQAD